ncbi:MAG: site-specific DNA-methyltransferase [Planctomycetaceae bacterium]
MNTIQQGDCIELMNRLKAGSVDLVFADPPFNIGYDYDVYKDKLEADRYLHWSRDWITAAHRVLKSNGTFWLAIGDEYAAELKIASQQIGFHCRSWVIWYYTFGVNCKQKFTRSHAHLFYFVKDPENFTFRADAPENRIPSARQLVYNDARANPKGRLPDDTWIIRPANVHGELSSDEYLTLDDEAPHTGDETWTLRPQDLATCFKAEEDTWYFPRVAGTFKERAGFHGCQMPEQLLGRIIRCCTEPGGVVLDPFSGSGTTVAVAKKLGRDYLAFDLSEQYVTLGLKRLESIESGDQLDGAPEPLVSAPSTKEGKRLDQRGSRKFSAARKLGKPQPESSEPVDVVPAPVIREVINPAGGDEQPPQDHPAIPKEALLHAFAATHRGYSADRLVTDPELNQQYIAACESLKLPGTPRDWNLGLFRLRKSGKLTGVVTTQATDFDWSDCDPFAFASEIAWRMLLDQGTADSLDEVLCDPAVAMQFDAIAGRFAPGFSPLQYRWAALKLRKQSRVARQHAVSLPLPTLTKGPKLDKFDKQLEQLDRDDLPSAAGLYTVGGKDGPLLYVGETLRMRDQFRSQFDERSRKVWQQTAEALGQSAKRLRIQFMAVDLPPSRRMAFQQRMLQEEATPLNMLTFGR